MRRLLVKEVSFPLLARRYGYGGLFKYFFQLDQSQRLPPDTIQAMQHERLHRLLRYAQKNCTYYSELFHRMGIDWSNDFSLQRFSTIPFLTKERIREHSRQLVSSALTEQQLHSSETGGTTGVKMQFWRDNACLAAKEAARYRFERWTGWNFGEPVGLVWPARQDYVGHWSWKARLMNALYERQVVFPAAVVDEEVCLDYISQMQRKKPTMIRAFTSQLVEVATVMVDRGLRCPSVRGIVTTGEPLYPHQRAKIEEGFACKVFNSYRSRELGPVAQECEQHNGLHLNAESLFVEILPPEGEQTLDDGVGEIVVTDLLNHGMPFIRYRTGDLGKLTPKSCPCGRGLPLLEKVVGRSSDMLYSPEGKAIAAGALVLYLVDEAPGPLGQVQVVQDRVDHLVIRVTPDPPPTEAIMQYQRRMVTELFGPAMQVSFDIVSHIERSESGKYLFARCLL